MATSERPGIYAVAVEVKGNIRVEYVQAKSSQDAERRILSGRVLSVSWHSGSQ